jgi:hypothetical protein
MAGDPGTRALLRTTGRGLRRLASMQGSVDSPHSKQRHPPSDSSPDSPLVRLPIIKPWQRAQRTEPSPLARSSGCALRGARLTVVPREETPRSPRPTSSASVPVSRRVRRRDSSCLSFFKAVLLRPFRPIAGHHRNRAVSFIGQDPLSDCDGTEWLGGAAETGESDARRGGARDGTVGVAQ